MIGSTIDEFRKKANLEELANKIFEMHAEHIYFVGGGPNYSTALFAMAKFRELKLAHSIAFELEEFMHYGNIPLTPRDPCIIMSWGGTNQRARDVIDLLKYMGARVMVLSDQDIGGDHNIVMPRVNEALSPILCLAAIHDIMVSIAKKKHGDRIEVEHGEYISKKIRAISQ